MSQALAQAGGLARLLGGEHVTAIVCVPRMKNRPIRSGGVWICSVAQLGWVLRQLDGHLTAHAADRYADRIRR